MNLNRLKRNALKTNTKRKKQILFENFYRPGMLRDTATCLNEIHYKEEMEI